VQAVSLEFMLMLGYAVLLGVAALLLEFAARHAHRRSLSISTTGFTYYAEKDMWRCPEFQHLFPVFVDHAKGSVIYRAPASTCNACRCKSHCTDSDNGREIERKNTGDLQYGMQRFHRAMSVTLFVLASLILIVEIFRDNAFYPRIVLAGVLVMFCMVLMRLSRALLSRTDRA
jgi:heme A synthase